MAEHMDNLAHALGIKIVYYDEKGRHKTSEDKSRKYRAPKIEILVAKDACYELYKREQPLVPENTPDSIPMSTKSLYTVKYR